MKSLFFLFTAFTLFLNAASAQIVNIPDANFKNALIDSACAYIGTDTIYTDVDTNNDGEIEVSEAAAVTRLNVSYCQIIDLTGIQSFTNLQHLNCGNNPLTNLDVESLTNLQYLDCGFNLLVSLHIQGLTNLQTLYCYSMLLTSLDVQSLTNLQYLDCGGYQLTSLNVQGLTNLQTLYCYSSGLASLNLQGLTNLQYLDCAANQFTNLNVQGLSNLQYLRCWSCGLTNLDVQGLTNLQHLYCDGNQFTSLNVQGLTNLQYLDCSSNNQLISLNVQGCINLQALYCNSDQLASLDVQGLTNLKMLYCNNNLLARLDLQGLINLEHLDCGYNAIPSLNVQGLVNLQSLSCSYNLLSRLDLQGLTNLRRLDCITNQLTSLNMQDCTNLQGLDCTNNLLTSLFIKNGSNEGLTFVNNFGLAYICCDDTQIAGVQAKAAQWGLANCTINSYCSFTPGGIFYTVQGDGKLDANINGCDTNDPVFPNMKYKITYGTNTANIVSNASGHYSIPVSRGIHTIKPIFENPTYFTASPDSIQITFPNTTSDTLTQNFCITPNGAHHDVEVTIIPIIAARPGFDAVYQIVYKNKGAVVESDSILFRFNDAKMDFVNASLPLSSQRSHTLAWYFSNLQPFETRSISVTMNINSPMETPAVNVGDVLSYQATIFPFITDEIPIDNSFTLNQTVIGSFDPNDKTCLEGNEITPDMVGSYLHYVIHFENTGTANATNIVVKDLIDTAKFDVKTLQMTKASHDCRVRILNGNQAEFIFETINLPFTEPDKHGFVAFKIKTKPHLVLGDAVTNKADIFFDYNFPITTNTATTQVAFFNSTEGAKPNSIAFSVSPNPTTDILTFKTDATVELCEIYDALGRIVQSFGIRNQSINVAHLPKGSYFIKVFGRAGTAVARFMKE